MYQKFKIRLEIRKQIFRVETESFEITGSLANE